MNNQEQFDGFTYNTKCTIWRISYLNKDKEYHIKNYYSDDYNIVSFNNSIIYSDNLDICINQLNMFYGELCTMYYVWKNNLKSDIVGFDQYRRQWNDIDFNKINENKIQVYTDWKTPKTEISNYINLNSLIYLFLNFIKSNYKEYSDKIDDIFVYNEYINSNYINIFICKWDIFDKICQIIFGFLDYILPNNAWQNTNNITNFINFNALYHDNIYKDTSSYILTSGARFFAYFYEFVFGILYNIISEINFADNYKEIGVMYECNTIDDIKKILKLYHYNIGNGVNAIFIKDKYNIFTENYNKFINNYDKSIYYTYINIYIINDELNYAYNCFDKQIIQCNNIKDEYELFFKLNLNEYIYSDNSIKLHKYNYSIKTIDDELKVYIITSARFEECYIEEWVQYNLNIGFDKIIINDNNPKDYPYQLKDILKKYIDNGQVIIERYWDTHEEDEYSQERHLYEIYTWMFDKYKDELDWFAKLDIDEFLEIPETNNNIKKFLQQDKFNNALSIVIPLETYTVKNEYKLYYTRLKNNRDRFYKCGDTQHMFKSIIKNTTYIKNIDLHFANFKDYVNLLNLNTEYMLPNAEDGKIKLLINEDADIMYKRCNQYCNYVIDNLLPICHINHYSDKCVEENCLKMKKFEVERGQWATDWYIELKRDYPEMFEHPRDLYKLYFIDNINNIK